MVEMGLNVLIDYTDSNTIYTTYQYGTLFRSTDGGITHAYIAPSSSSNFYANYSMNPLNSHTLYAAYDEVYKTSDGGDNLDSNYFGFVSIFGRSVFNTGCGSSFRYKYYLCRPAYRIVSYNKWQSRGIHLHLLLLRLLLLPDWSSIRTMRIQYGLPIRVIHRIPQQVMKGF